MNFILDLDAQSERFKFPVQPGGQHFTAFFQKGNGKNKPFFVNTQRDRLGDHIRKAQNVGRIQCPQLHFFGNSGRHGGKFLKHHLDAFEIAEKFRIGIDGKTVINCRIANFTRNGFSGSYVGNKLFECNTFHAADNDPR